MIKKFEQYNESVRDHMTPKSDEEVNNSYKYIQHLVYESYDDMDMLINENVLDHIFRNIDKPSISNVKKALNTMTDEIVNTWESSTGYDDGLTEGLTDQMTPKSEAEIEEGKKKLLADLKVKTEDDTFPSEYFLQHLFQIYGDRKQLMNDLLAEGMQVTDILMTITDDLDFNATSESDLRYKKKVKNWMYNLIEKNIDKLHDSEI